MSLPKAYNQENSSNKLKGKYCRSNSSSHLPVLEILTKAMDTGGSWSRALPATKQPGSQNCLGTWRIWLQIYPLIQHREWSLNHQATEYPWWTSSSFLYWWHLISYWVIVQLLDEKRWENENVSVMEPRVVIQSMHAAASSPVGI